MSSASATDAQSPPPRDSRRPQTRPASRGSRAILLALIVCAVAAPVAAIAKTPGEVEVGQTLRDATLRGLNGPTRKLSDFRGRPVIINVWASWCGPCRQEMASLERLAWKEHATPFAIIGISTDDYPEKARRLLDGTNATISHFIDANLLLENMLGASRLPLTVLVDANGRVVDKIYGARQWDSPEAMALIGKAFAGRGPVPGR